MGIIEDMHDMCREKFTSEFINDSMIFTVTANRRHTIFNRGGVLITSKPDRIQYFVDEPEPGLKLELRSFTVYHERYAKCTS